jgi:acetyl esterase/lipase
VVASLDFRQAPESTFPSSVADVNYGVRWFKAHAGEFNATPEGLGGMGASSGGHLIMLNAMQPRDSRYVAQPLAEGPDLDATVAYVVGGWPILDPYARYLWAQDLGYTGPVSNSEDYFVTAEAMQEGNPQRILDHGEPVELPPLLIVQGTNDNNVPPAMQAHFVDSYGQAGGYAELAIFPGQVHGFGFQPGDPADRARALIKMFVARQLDKLRTAT